MKKVVILGGGLGAAIFTKSLKDLPIRLTTIVSSFDDGGSTGLIRRDYGGWAVGDWRNCLLAASELSKEYKDSLEYRFGPGQLYGMQIGNLVIKAILNTHRPFIKANRIIHEQLKVRHAVLPVSLTDSKITALLSNGRKLVGQREISDYLSFARAPIKRISLTKKSRLLPQARQEILEADLLVFAPGHFFTSILPHLSVEGFAHAWQKSQARKLWFVNLLAHKGQDNYYSLTDYLKWFQKILGLKPFDEIWYNAKIGSRLANQVEDRFEPLRVLAKDLAHLKKSAVRAVNKDLVKKSVTGQQENDFILRAPIRHDSEKIKQAFKQILNV
jgi:uncharacterized cofD-like protein